MSDAGRPAGAVPGAAALQRAGRRTLCAIGNFDGVHLGHRALLDDAERDARVGGLLPVVMTFDPHPAIVIGREPPSVLTPLDRKVDLLARAAPGVSVVVERFDRAYAAMTPEEFARRVLVGQLDVARVVVGRNFRFGRKRSGNLSTLEALGASLGFAVGCAELRGDAKGRWSSTRARNAITAGDWAEVRAVLGRPHALSGKVVEGARRGKAIGFPTANLAEVPEALPPHGVYAVVVDRLDGGVARALGKGVANLGLRPTVGGGPSIEVHLLDFDGDLYGARLRMHLLSFLREERKFGGLDELGRQIARDVARGRELLATVAPDPSAGGAWY